MTIRPEHLEDHEAIGAVNRAAFGGEAEARLVELLRQDGDLRCSLVALVDDRIVGHVGLSRLTLRTQEGEVSALALAPVAVIPQVQGRGIGSALIRHGLEGFPEQLVVVLGEPGYYERFGFKPEYAAELRCPYSGPYLQANRPAAGELFYAGGFSRCSI